MAQNLPVDVKPWAGGSGCAAGFPNLPDHAAGGIPQGPGREIVPGKWLAGGEGLGEDDLPPRAVAVIGVHPRVSGEEIGGFTGIRDDVEVAGPGI